MARTMDDLKMVHEEEMKNYDRIESAVVSVMRRHGCKIIQTPTFEDYDTYGTYFPQLQREMIKTIGPDGEVLVMRPDVTVPLVKTVAREYLEPLRQEGLDTLILGCTHYPLLTDIIGDIMGPGVTLINASEEGAWELKRTLRSMDLLAPEKQTGQATLCASDQPEDFGALASYFLRETLSHPVRPVDIDRY